MTTLDDLGKFILRVTVAGLLLFHGLSKVQNGIGFVEQMVVENGLPVILAYGVYIGEVVAPLLIIVGFWSRPAALIVAFDLAGAILMAKPTDVTKVTPGGAWGVEVEMFFILTALAIACLGAGRIAIGRPSPVN